MDEEDHRCYSDLLEFHFFELSKLKRLFEMGCLEELEETGLERLLRYLGRIGGESEMDRLVEQDPGIERLRRGEQSFFRVPGNLASYRMRERMETDHWRVRRLRLPEDVSQGVSDSRTDRRTGVRSIVLWMRRITVVIVIFWSSIFSSCRS